MELMKEENPKLWWKDFKRLCGAKPSADNVTSHIHIERIEDMSYEELANVINQAFLEPLEEYRLTQPLTKLPVDEDSPELLEVSELRVKKLLTSLNPSKACGPDDIPNWLLKEYAELLAFPVSKIINASFEEQSLPRIWKFADVSPLHKAKPVEVFKKQLRPTSLTPCLSKVAEDCVVVDYAKPAVLQVLDPNQYGAVPKSSTTQALIHMVHHWSKETDGNGATVRVTLFDYQKAFDLIDHKILVNKLCKLSIPTRIINWIINFLSDRFQRIKLSEGCYSEWGSVPSGVPQGTKLGPWLFLVLINDLAIDNGIAHIWKYVDDTTASEVVIKGRASNAQRIADNVAKWSSDNRVKLNSDKCKELRIWFAKEESHFADIVINNEELGLVNSAKLLGVTISNNLTWNEHFNEIIKKASKRLYFLSQLKRARVAKQDLVLFYTSCIRSILTYASPVFFDALPEYLKNELERIQKRALRIICPGHCYNDAMELANIVPISDYILEICKQTFDRIINDYGHRLYSVVEQRGSSQYALGRTRRFSVPKCKTERCMNSFIIRSSINYI